MKVPYLPIANLLLALLLATGAHAGATPAPTASTNAPPAALGADTLPKKAEGTKPCLTPSGTPSTHGR